jgi:hypothetical protein
VSVTDERDSCTYDDAEPGHKKAQHGREGDTDHCGKHVERTPWTRNSLRFAMYHGYLLKIVDARSCRHQERALVNYSMPTSGPRARRQCTRWVSANRHVMGGRNREPVEDERDLELVTELKGAGGGVAANLVTGFDVD